MADVYNVIRGDGVFFEGMTKEQIITAIAEATGVTVEDIDSAFITKLKEINKGNTIQIWMGTNAEYNAIENKLDDVLYIVTDDTFVNDTNTSIEDLYTKIEANYSNVEVRLNGQDSTIETFQESVNAQIEEIMDILGMPVKNYSFTCNQKYTSNYTKAFNISSSDFEVGVSTEVNVVLTVNGYSVRRGSIGDYEMEIDDTGTTITLQGSFNVASIETVSISYGSLSGNTTGEKTNGVITFTPSTRNAGDINKDDINFPPASVVLHMRVVRLS